MRDVFGKKYEIINSKVSHKVPKILTFSQFEKSAPK
jgi:hypothetical protein